MTGLEQFAMMFGCCVKYQCEAHSTALNAINRIEIASYLSGMSDNEVNYVYAFFGDEVAESRLTDFVIARALRLARMEEWKSCGCDRIEAMAALAVQENLHNLCRLCKGTGSRKLKVCQHCYGTGYARLSGRIVANLIGVDHSNFSRLWKRRYDCIYVIVQDIQCVVMANIYRS